MSSRQIKYLGLFLAVILFIISFGSGYLLGQTVFVREKITDASGQVDISKVINMNRRVNHVDSVDFNEFWQVWDRVKEKYVSSTVSDTDLFYGAVQGMVMALNDPYSIFFPPKAADEFAKDLNGEFEGIGAELGVKQGQLTIIAPLPGTPAEKVGLRAGDLILKIDGVNCADWDTSKAVSKIRGPGGTAVTLTIGRAGLDKARDFRIIREKINVPSVMFSWQANSVAYLRVMQFNDRTQIEFEKYIDQLKRGGARGVILDLRNNPGGYLDMAVSMAGEWLPEGTLVVSEKSNDGTVRRSESSGQPRLEGMKTIVLVNGGSASASEIVAGALQDHEQATIIGEKTFGKGSVQDYEAFPDGSALKLTVAEWLTPDGRNINKEGITPDIEVKEEWDKEKVGEDKMIDKALELLK